MSGALRFKHIEQPSEMIRLPDGGLRYRVRCSCGWQSQSVTADRTIETWEEHKREPNGKAPSTAD